MSRPANPSPERMPDLIDVHLLDIAAQIEALLRSVREIQHDVLRLRGVAPPNPATTPADHIQNRLEGMLDECRALQDAVEHAAVTAATLTDSTRDG